MQLDFYRFLRVHRIDEVFHGVENQIEQDELENLPICNQYLDLICALFLMGCLLLVGLIRHLICLPRKFDLVFHLKLELISINLRT